MKKSAIIFAAIVMMVVFTTSLKAQTNTENTTAGAKIVSALTILETQALHFGTMAIPTSASTVLLTPANVRSVASGTISLLAQAPVATNAAYTVAGMPDATYAIALPNNTAVTITSGANHMHVTDFVANTTSTNSSTSGLLSGGGADGIAVGATLNLDNVQPAGVYSGTFDITVNYN